MNIHTDGTPCDGQRVHFTPDTEYVCEFALADIRRQFGTDDTPLAGYDLGRRGKTTTVIADFIPSVQSVACDPE